MKFVLILFENNNLFTNFKNPLILTNVTILVVKACSYGLQLSLKCKKSRVSSDVLWLRHIA